MLIGVDASCWANERGYGRFTREIVSAMVRRYEDDEWVCFLDPRSASRFDLAAANLRVCEVRQARSPTEAAVASGSRSLADMFRFTAAVWKEKPDVFFSPSVYTFFPLPPRQRALITIHDAIAERFPELTLPKSRDRVFWGAKVGLAIRQARLVLTVSNYARAELERELHLPAQKIRVAGEAPATVFSPESNPDHIRTVASRAGVPDGSRWFTYVGGFNPHKNVEAVIRAHAALVRTPECVDWPPHLVLVGSTESEGFFTDSASIPRTILEEGTGALVHMPGFLPDNDLRCLHSGAIASVLLSESEGFGLPAVEAAACGCPVIATTESPLPELLARGGIFVAPSDVAGAARAMISLATDEKSRAEFGRCARERATKLSWDRAAVATRAALVEVAT